MARTSFTKAAAQAKVGRQVRTHISFAEVPEGALGTIVRSTRRKYACLMDLQHYMSKSAEAIRGHSIDANNEEAHQRRGVLPRC